MDKYPFDRNVTFHGEASPSNRGRGIDHVDPRLIQSIRLRTTDGDGYNKT